MLYSIEMLDAFLKKNTQILWYRKYQQLCYWKCTN